MAEWEELKRKVRSLESRLEEKCQAYSFLAQRMNSDLLYDEGALVRWCGVVGS